MTTDPLLFVVFPLLALLAATAVTVARTRDLWAAAMLTGMYSFLGASWMTIMDAPDVAFTEAAVGAGISTVLLLGTLAFTKNRKAKKTKSGLMPLIVVVVTGAILVYGTFDMPPYGDDNAPIQTYPEPNFVEKSASEVPHIPNVITVLLASFRGYDTLGETTVIFTAGIAVLMLLRGKHSYTEVSAK